MLPIMDVSRWQGDINWGKVKASGLVSGVMLRALGNSAEDKPSKPYIDPYFARNYAECQRLGIPCGVYYYCKAVNTAEADAELALLRKVLTGKTVQLPVAVDIEDNYVQAPLDKQTLTDIAAHALGTVERWGFYAMLYTGLYFGETNLYMGGAALKPYDVWLAAYRSKSPHRNGALGCGSTPARARFPVLWTRYRARFPAWTCLCLTRTTLKSSQRRV